MARVNQNVTLHFLCEINFEIKPVKVSPQITRTWDAAVQYQKTSHSGGRGAKISLKSVTHYLNGHQNCLFLFYFPF
jgi:hypothetical protein